MGEEQLVGKCEVCKRDDVRSAIPGICHACITPEALTERISHLPEPSRGTFERVGKRFGLIEKPEDTDA